MRPYRSHFSRSARVRGVLDLTQSRRGYLRKDGELMMPKNFDRCDDCVTILRGERGTGCIFLIEQLMNLDQLSLRLKHLLEVVDRLEFNAEQNRRQIAETRQIVVRIARAFHVAGETARKKPSPHRRTLVSKKRK